MDVLSRRALLGLLVTGTATELLSCGTPAAATSTPASVRTAGSSGPAGAPTVKSAQSQTLTAMTWGDPSVQRIMTNALQEFEQQHPGTKAGYISTQGADHYTKLDTMMAGGVPPSVFYMDPSLMPAYATKGVLGALDSYVSQSGYDLTDFYPKALSQYYWESKLYGVARGFGNQDLYWNAGLFDKAGVAAPAEAWDDAAWTTDAFLERADKLTVRSGGKTTQFGYGQGLGLRQWEPWVWLFGGEVVDKTNGRCLLAEQPAMSGLQFLADLMLKHKVMPTPDYTQQENNASLFASGRLAMNMDIPAALDTYRKLTSITWDVAPLPKNRVAVTSGGGISWAMDATAPNPQARWELLAWVTGKEVQTRECEASATAPPRRSVAESSCYVDPKRPPKHMAVFLKAPDVVHIDPQVRRWSEIQTLLNKELSFLWDGSKRADEVLPALAPKVTALLQTS